MSDFVNWYHKNWRIGYMGTTQFDEDIHWVNIFLNIQKKVHLAVGVSIDTRAINFHLGLLVFYVSGVIWIRNIFKDKR